MLQTINDKAKGILGWVIIALISIPFALWGIQEYVGGGPQPFAAKVNELEVSPAEFDQAVVRQKQQLKEMFGGQLPENPAFDKRIKQQVIDQLINRKLLEEYIEQTGYSVSDTQLVKNIQQMEAFQENGHFAAKNYKELVNSRGMSVSQFEYVYRQDLQVQQLQDAITATSFVSPAEIALVNKIQNQQRDVSYVVFEEAKYEDKISLTEAEISQYYKNNPQQFLSQETSSVSYIELNASDIKAETTVSEDELRRLYDEYVSSIANTEERKASHILAQVSADADDATRAAKKLKIEASLKKLSQGQSFAEVAKSDSEDPGSAAQGGDLGWVAKGMMVPAFEAALFKLKQDEVSAIVESEFGYHIIKLDEIKSSKVASFEEKRAELVESLQQQEIDNLFYERSELMATLAYENDDSLEPVADALSTSIKHSDVFSRMTGNGLAKNNKLRQAAFSDLVLKEGRNSDVIELAKNHIIVLRTDQHQPAKPKPLTAVKAQVKALLSKQKIKALAEADSNKAIADLKAGKSLADVAKDKQIEFKNLNFVGRKSTAADRTIIQQAFAMPKPVADKPNYDTFDLARGLALIGVNAVKFVDTADEAETAKLQEQMQNDVANREVMALIGMLRAKADITIANNLFNTE